MGYSLNFLECIKKIKNDIIFICDQDDVWAKEKVEKMIYFVQENPDMLCWMHDCSITNSKLQVKINSKIKNLKKNFHSEHAFVMGACMAINKDAKNIIFPYPKNMIKYGHDNWIAFALRSVDKLKTLNESLLLYRRHEKNTSLNNINSKITLNKFLRFLIKSIQKIINFKNSIKNKNQFYVDNFNWAIQLKNNLDEIGNNEIKVKEEFKIKTLKMLVDLMLNLLMSFAQ